MLTILSVAFPFARVDADPPGGAEQVLATMDRALVTAGHRSIVIAVDGSATMGELRPIPPTDRPDDEPERGRIRAALRARIAEAIAEDRPDVIHLHGLDFAGYLPPPGPPVLVTLHLPLDWYADDELRPDRARTYLQPVSADQATRVPVGVTLVDPVPNGVDVDLYRPAPKQDYALVLGRVAPEKGFHNAIDAARLAGVPLRAAGKVYPYPAHQLYFDRQVAPRLDAERRWVGEMRGAAKRALLAEAACVLIPSTAPETSSLVAMEALASGTPVIAYRSGALPAIVEDGRTGYIVDSMEEMARAIGRIQAIDPAACRQAACERFPLAHTIRAYLDLYAQLAA